MRLLPDGLNPKVQENLVEATGIDLPGESAAAAEAAAATAMPARRTAPRSHAVATSTAANGATPAAKVAPERNSRVRASLSPGRGRRPAARDTAAAAAPSPPEEYKDEDDDTGELAHQRPEVRVQLFPGS